MDSGTLRLPPGVLAALSAAVPAAEAGRAALAGAGWDVLAWRIPAPDADWLLRVPRHPDAIPGIEAQTALYAVLARRGLPVPRDASLLRDAEGRTLAGLYRYVEGQPAHVRGRRERARLASMLAEFLNALHATDLVELELLSPLRYEPWRDEFGPMVERYAPLLPPRAAAWVREVGARTAAASVSMPPAVLVHYDLKPAHVLLDEEARIAAILDFEGLRVSDPALDFARIMLNWDHGLALAVIDGYRHPVDAGFLERAECYRELDALESFAVATERGMDDWVTRSRRILAARARRDGQ